MDELSRKFNFARLDHKVPTKLHRLHCRPLLHILQRTKSSLRKVSCWKYYVLNILVNEIIETWKAFFILN